MGLDISRGFAEQVVVVNRRVIGEGIGRHLGGNFTVLNNPHDVAFKHAAHHGRLEAPAAKTGHQDLLLAWLHHKEHALLGFTEQELIGRHPDFPGGHLVEVELHPNPTFGSHLRTATGEAGGTHVLGGHHITTLESLQTGFDQALLQKGIAHLHRWTVIQGSFGEFGAGKAGAPHAVAARGAAHVDHGITNPLGPRTHDVVGFHQPEGHGIHQRVTGVAGIKGHLTPHGGNAHAIAVMGDAGHNPLHQAHIALVFQGAKAQGIEQGYRPGPHGEDVAQDAAHTGGCPLKRLHR